MKLLKIQALYTANRAQKTLTFPIPDDMADHMHTLFQALHATRAEGLADNTDPQAGFVSEGQRAIRLTLAMLDDEMKC